MLRRLTIIVFALLAADKITITTDLTATNPRGVSDGSRCGSMT